MGNAGTPQDVLLFMSVLYRQDRLREKAIESLKERFGKVVHESPPMAFAFTDYYEEEMGGDLSRVLLAFAHLTPRDSLAGVKNDTNALEDGFREEGKRRVNLDPGLLSLENVCLATTKPYAHRIYLSLGIWAEVTLVYHDGSYQPMPWTYPDYRSAEMVTELGRMRDIYKDALTCRRSPRG
ncbi:DUF4416 family protein [Candidatus Eisenbacteria bacterium]|uniref:DUF4416 family protein n=1 Tax=Eiseniibacteriota bacterium TaxID=2212470 RepID=A0ABV6YIV8_UNCEI